MKGYSLIEQQYVSEIGANGYVYRHDKSGARVFYLSNPNDDNKVFCISFCTPPEDDCGTPHILEHSVLCGSDKYPLKDPFMQLEKGSLKTFLNAMTYPDKTMYPVASQNDKDFMTLMDVYLDAVFHPTIRHSRNAFMQEGWHYVPNEDGTSISVKGVVYNEMKGAFSASDEVLMREIKKELNPEGPYQYESGGTPDAIPNLTYERYLDFYNRHYQAANSYIYIYGNGNMEEHLAFLDEQYLSRMEDTGLSYQIDPQPRFAESRCKESFFAANDEEEKPYFSYSVSYGPVTDPMLFYAGDILEYMLLEAEGAPLKRALQDQKFGEDIYGINDSSLLEPIMGVIVKGADPSKEKDFPEAVRSACRRIVEVGFSQDLVEGALNSFEFRLREADFGTTPKGLVYLINAMATWLHGESPMKLLQYAPVMEEMRRRASEGYFEQLLATIFLDNSQTLIYTLRPDMLLGAKKEQENQAAWDAYFASLSDEEKQDLIRTDIELTEFQQSPETEEALHSIPLLQLTDIDPKAEEFPYSVGEIEGSTALRYHDFTNGIAYVKLLFDMRAVPVEEIAYVNLLTELLGSIDTRNHTYEELGNMEALHTGGVSIGLRTAAETDEGYKAYVQVAGKSFYRELPAMLSLIRELLLETEFTDKGRLSDMLFEIRSRFEMQMQTAGHQFALNRARANVSRTAAFSEYAAGTAYYDILCDLLDHLDEKLPEAIEHWKSICQKVFVRENLLIHVTEDADAEKTVTNELSSFVATLPSGSQLRTEEPAPLMEGNVGIESSSMVQYVASVGTFAEPYSGKLFVLRSILSQDYLWDQIRVLGGAYGCMTGLNRRQQWYFVSYRDPNLKRTLQVYEGAVDYAKQFDVSDREMQKYIIGTISDISHPLTVSLKGARTLDMYLNNITDAMHQQVRTEVLHTTQEDIRELASAIEDVASGHTICVFGNADRLKEEGDLFDSLVEWV